MRITLKIAAILLLVLGFGVGLTAFLSQAKFERTLEDLVRSRLDVVAVDLKNTVEATLGLGLALEEARNIEDALAAAAAADPEILSIALEDARGDPVFATENRDPDAPALVVRAPVENAFGQIAGTIVVRGSRAAVDGVARTVRDRQILLSLVAVGVATLLGGAIAWLLLRGLLRHFREAEEALAAMLRGRTEPVGEPPADADPLDREFIAFRGHARAAFVSIHQAEQRAEAENGAPPAPEGR